MENTSLEKKKLKTLGGLKDVLQSMFSIHFLIYL